MFLIGKKPTVFILSWCGKRSLCSKWPSIDDYWNWLVRLPEFWLSRISWLSGFLL